MKLAKKMLACALALAMVAALALTTFAAATTFSVAAVKSDDGKQVVVTLSATEYAGFKSGSLTVSYDHTALEFVKGAGTATSAVDGLTVVAGIPAGKTAEDDVISVGLMYAETATNANEDVLTLTFNVVDAKNSTISVAVGEWDGTDKPADVSVNVVMVEETTKAPETTTAAPETTTAAPETTTVVEDASEVAPETTTKTPDSIAPLGDAGVAAVAGVMALAAVAFVVTRKKDAE